jgi:hypothetical protein
MVKTTLLFPELLWQQLKIRAVEERRSLRDLVQAAAEAYLKRPPAPKKGTR